MFRLLPCLLVCLILRAAPPTARAPTEAGADDPIFITVSDDGSPLPDGEAMQVLAEQSAIVFFETACAAVAGRSRISRRCCPNANASRGAVHRSWSASGSGNSH